MYAYRDVGMNIFSGMQSSRYKLTLNRRVKVFETRPSVAYSRKPIFPFTVLALSANRLRPTNLMQAKRMRHDRITLAIPQFVPNYTGNPTTLRAYDAQSKAPGD